MLRRWLVISLLGVGCGSERAPEPVSPVRLTVSEVYCDRGVVEDIDACAGALRGFLRGRKDRVVEIVPVNDAHPDTRRLFVIHAADAGGVAGDDLEVVFHRCGTGDADPCWQAAPLVRGRRPVMVFDVRLAEPPRDARIFLLPRERSAEVTSRRDPVLDSPPVDRPPSGVPDRPLPPARFVTRVKEAIDLRRGLLVYEHGDPTHVCGWVLDVIAPAVDRAVKSEDLAELRCATKDTRTTCTSRPGDRPQDWLTLVHDDVGLLAVGIGPEAVVPADVVGRECPR